MTQPTRVCTRCRHRKPLAEFYRHGSQDRSYRTQCKSCFRIAQRGRDRRTRHHGDRRHPLGTFHCEYCDREQRRRCANQRICSSLECQRAKRREQKQRMKLKSPTGLCIDCGKPAYFSRCEYCRGVHQREIEVEFCKAEQSPGLCALPVRGGICNQVLSFGTDGMGRTVMWCPTHGESLVPTIGIRHYDQRVVLDDEIDASIERASKRPEPKPTDHLGGQHWRRESNAYVGDHPWRQKKRSAA